MTGTGTDKRTHCTHVEEWADLIGADVPDRAKTERLLRWPPAEDEDPDREVTRNGKSEWSHGAS